MLNSIVVKLITIYEYKDFRKYLEDVIGEIKKNTNHTYRRISADMGFASSNFVISITSGRRNLSAKSIEKISQFLKHNDIEKSYFKNLVLFNQATSFDDRLLYSSKLVAVKAVSDNLEVTNDTLVYYSNWLNVLIREMSLLPDFKFDASWIQQKSFYAFSLEQIKDSMDLLLKLKLLEKRSEDGKVVSTKFILRAPDKLKAELVRNYHLQMIEKSTQAMAQVEQELRDITSLTMPVAIEDLDRLKKMIAEFRLSLANVSEGYKSPDAIYQINFQVFPLTKN